MFGKKKTSNALPGSNRGVVSNDQIMYELAQDYMKDRKWRRYFKLGLFALFVLYVIGVFALTKGGAGAGPTAKLPHTALVSLEGVIGGPNGVTSNQINHSLRKAFQAKQSQAVILRVNSPGGTPVQAANINEEIYRLKAEFPNKPIYTVVADLCASGGYFVAAATDKIFANRSSIVGSIGVRMDSFGFVDTLKKVGVERRSITAGENKAILDPFLPLQPEQRKHAETMLAEVHQHFIDIVQEGRGDKLSDNPDLFSGLFWTGKDAQDLGLVDEIGGVDYVAREVVGQKELVDYSFRPNFLEELSGRFGVAIGKGIGSVLESRLDASNAGSVRLQ